MKINKGVKKSHDIFIVDTPKSMYNMWKRAIL